MHANDPALFDRLPQVKRTVLLEWIAQTMEPSSRTESYASDKLNERFDAVGFRVSTGAFKGAMLAAGYEPIDSSEQHWHFRCRPRCCNPYDTHDYSLDHLTDEQRKKFNKLVWRALEKK